MKPFKSIARKVLPAIILLAIATGSFSQVNYTANNVNLVVNGTSTLHDWDMKSSKSSCRAVFTFNSTGQINGLTALSFTTTVSDLKSDHTSMDNNAYKALKSSQAPGISYNMITATVTPVDVTTVAVRCNGKLTIAGQTSDEEVVATCKLNADKTITVTGVKTLSMKNFSVSPPTFMFGTVKTGNDITLNFNLQFKK
jgi:hypothetical protein